MTPHLTHRYEAYTFPNPWKNSNWGVGGETLRDARRIDYVLVHEGLFSAEDRTLYDSVIVNSGDFELRFRPAASAPQIVVWRRIRNGLHKLPPPVKPVSIGEFTQK